MARMTATVGSYHGISKSTAQMMLHRSVLTASPLCHSQPGTFAPM
jgi:hypothetical protein